MDADAVRASREALEDFELQAVHALDKPPLSIDEFYHTATLSDGFECKLKVWRSKSEPPGGRPVIVLGFGGGHLMGSIEQETTPGREFAEEFNALVIAPSYRRAPEHKFPTGTNDAWSATLWLAQGGAETLGGSLSAGFILGGHSSGSQNAAVVSQLAVDRSLTPPVTGTFLMIPQLLAEEIVPDKYKALWTSRVDNADHPRINTAMLDQLNLNWGPDVQSPLFSPLAGERDHSKHSPTYLQVCELDPLRDDGVVYERILKDNGVPTKLDLLKGVNHQSWCLVGDHSYDQELLKATTLDGMRWLLSFGHPRQ